MANVVPFPGGPGEVVPLQQHRGSYPRNVVPGYKLAARRKARGAPGKEQSGAEPAAWQMKAALRLARTSMCREAESAACLPEALRQRVQEICRELELIEHAVDRL